MAVESEFPRTLAAHRPESAAPAGGATRGTVEGAVVRSSARAESPGAPASAVVAHGRIREARVRVVAPPVGVTIVIIVVVKIIVVVVTFSSVSIQLGLTERNPNRNPIVREREREKEKWVMLCVPLLRWSDTSCLSGLRCYAPLDTTQS